MSVRYGQSWRTGPGRRAWVSGPLWIWVLAWLVMLPFIAAWLAARLTVMAVIAVIRGIAWLIARIRDAPAVPPTLRTPPRRP